MTVDLEICPTCGKRTDEQGPNFCSNPWHHADAEGQAAIQRQYMETRGAVALQKKWSKLDWLMLEPLSYGQRIMVMMVFAVIFYILHAVGAGWPQFIPLVVAIWASMSAYWMRVFG